jgi:hypothetical protein
MIMILSAIASLLPSHPRRMRLIKSGPLTIREIEKLDAFLLSDGGLENAMDVSTLDGFLCAVLSGPKVITPSEWIRWVWDREEGKQAPEFASEKQAQRILGLLMRLEVIHLYGTEGGWNKLKTLVDAHEDADARHQAFVDRIALAAHKIHAYFSTFKTSNAENA